MSSKDYFSYRNNAFKSLCNVNGFSIEEIKCQEDSIWICIKREKEGNIIFAFYDYNNKSCIDIIKSKMKSEGKYYRIILVSLNEKLESIEGSVRYSEGIVQKIIINPISNKVLYADSGCSEIANTIIALNNRNPKSDFGDFGKCYITGILVGINVLLYIISVLMSKNLFDIDIYTLYALGAKYTPAIYNGEVWRLATSMFLHGSIMHILCNMYSLLILGSQIEKIFGRVQYLIIYFVSGLCAGVFSTVFDIRHVSVGASGAIFGLLGSLVVITYVNRKNISRGFIGNIIAVIFINLFIGFSGTNIDNFAHIGGMVSGLIISSLLVFINRFNTNKTKEI